MARAMARFYCTYNLKVVGKYEGFGGNFRPRAVWYMNRGAIFLAIAIYGSPYLYNFIIETDRQKKLTETYTRERRTKIQRGGYLCSFCFKIPPFYFLSNSEYQPLLRRFGAQQPEKTCCKCLCS